MGRIGRARRSGKGGNTFREFTDSRPLGDLRDEAKATEPLTPTPTAPWTDPGQPAERTNNQPNRALHAVAGTVRSIDAFAREVKGYRR
jgi:hypothetical protein